MIQPLNYLKETPSQTAGPYVHIGLTPKPWAIPASTPRIWAARPSATAQRANGSSSPAR